MLEIDHLTRRFGDVTAVDDVTFTVPDGALTGFVGGNGAGKTTTMRMIMGLLAVHGGEVRTGGRSLTADDRSRFGYMPEERGLYPKQKILDQLVFLGRLHGMSASAARTEASGEPSREITGARGAGRGEGERRGARSGPGAAHQRCSRGTRLETEVRIS